MAADQPLTNPDLELGGRHLVTLRIGARTYALPLEPVEQIVEMVTIVTLPQADPSVEGVIEVRGRAVPVIDLRRQLAQGVTPRGLHTPLVLLRTRERGLALIVDEVLSVLSVTPDMLMKPRDIMPQGVSYAPLLLGLARTEQGLIPILSPEHLCQVTTLALEALEAQAAEQPAAEPAAAEPVAGEVAANETAATVVAETQPQG